LTWAAPKKWPISCASNVGSRLCAPTCTYPGLLGETEAQLRHDAQECACQPPPNKPDRAPPGPEATQRNPASAPAALSPPRLTPAGQNPCSPRHPIRPQTPQLNSAKPMLRQHDLPTLRLTGEAVVAATAANPGVLELETLTTQLAHPNDGHIVSLNLTISHSRIVRLLPWHGPKQKHQAEPPKADGAVSIRS
jgi:hypothetical protein